MSKSDTTRNAPPQQFYIRWIDGHREPQVKPNPAYPKGIDVEGVRPGETGCRVALPYPAKRIGNYIVECKLCGFRLSLTTAGRPDDPRSVSVPCKIGSWFSTGDLEAETDAKRS